ncbi:MAG: zinc-binding dehydrogenase [Alphaproteobacteria bacterium]|nr:zinc-binding dehydrogenase [Alphaproteobacteria bacterium]
MRAIVLEQPDETRETMSVQDVPEPEPAADEVVVAVAYAGLNFADLMMRKGVYPHPKGYPLVAGIELAGTVASVGSAVTTAKVGDRVAAFVENAGAFAEFCAVPAERLFRLPDNLDFDKAAAFLVQGLTAWHLLNTVSTTKSGDVVLIHAIGGGVGLYLTQIAKLAGAMVLGTVGTTGKEQRALDFGADLVVNRTEQNFVETILNFTGGKEVDKLVDSTGASILDRSFELLRPLGHVVSYGEAEGKPYPNLWEQLVRRSLTFTRLHLGHLDCHSKAWAEGAEQMLAHIDAGSITVPIEGDYPMTEASAMFDHLASRQVAGKLLLKVA